MTEFRRGVSSACLGVATVLFAVPGVAAEHVFLADGEAATVGAALEQARASGAPTVIVVPAGEWDYGDAKLLIDTVDGLVIIGAGEENTRLYRSVCQGGAMLQVETSQNVRVSGITFDGCDDPASQANAIGVQMWDVLGFRVDHCFFREHGHAGVRTNADEVGSWGVVDHCRFAMMYKTDLNLGYGVAVSGIGVIQNVPFGAADATFVEDSTFDGSRHAVAAGGGARYVFRYNTVTNNVVSHGVDAHGTEGSATVGTEWVEVYKNVIHQPGTYNLAAVRIRGGKGLVWDNEVNGYIFGVSLWEKTTQKTGPVHIWSNQWGSGQGVGDIQGAPTWDTAKPASYTPYVYPHPAVVDLDVRAGLDQNVIAQQGSLALSYLDATGSSASEGVIVGYRWYDGGELISSCARDVVELSEGPHVILLEAERSDGLTEVDTLVVRAYGDGPIKSGASWPNRWFVPLVGKGTLEFDVEASADGMNGYVAFTGRRKVDAHEDNAVILRFNPEGRIDAYDGSSYRAQQAVPYEANATRHVIITVDVAGASFDATVDGVEVATGYAFRTKVQTLGQMTLWDASGQLSVKNLVVTGELAQADSACRGHGGAAGAGGDGGEGGASSGGEAGEVEAGASDAGSTGAIPPDSDGSSGCGCSVPGPRPSAFGVGLWAVAFLLRRRSGARHQAGLQRRSRAPALTKK